MRVRHVGAATVLTAMALNTMAAGAAPPAATTISALEVARAGNTITASGAAVFADASNAVVGTDPAGDVGVADVGLDITQAAVRDAGNDLVFTMTIGDPLPEPLFTVPEVTTYLWHIRVTNGTQAQNYQLLAMRSGQYNRTVPFPDYLFRVHSCGSTASGEPSCFNVAGVVAGRMVDGIVEWTVPKPLIAALPGAVITAPQTEREAKYGAETAYGASGAAYVRGATAGDLIQPAPYVVGPAVSAGVRRASSSPGSVAFTAPAALGRDGSFTAKVATPALPGEYIVAVRACHGHSEGCGYAESPLTVE